MQLPLPTRPPFAFDQTLAFIRRFPPCLHQVVVADDRVTAAFALGGRAWPVTVRAGLTAEVPDAAPADVQRALVRRAAELVSAADDLAPFYAAAAGDRAFAPIVRALHGLHHVRFLGLEEIAVYCVLMQRTPLARAVELERRFLDRFGIAVRVADRTLRAMPELAALARIDPADIAAALRHPSKAERIATVVRGVAALGERFLRTAPYAAARDALLAIPGIGTFSAAAILLRGLGRMDELPSFAMFEREARAVYGSAWDPSAVARRYGAYIGYWSFYLKAGARVVHEPHADEMARAHHRRRPDGGLLRRA